MKYHLRRKNAMKILKILSFFLHLYFLLKYFLNLRFLQLAMITRSYFSKKRTSLYMQPTDYTFGLYDKNQDLFTSIASIIMSLYQYWLDNGVKIFSLQFNFILRPSIYDLKTDESDPSFLSLSQNTSHHQT